MTSTTRRDFIKTSLAGLGALSIGYAPHASGSSQIDSYPNAQFLMEPEDLLAHISPALSGCPTAMRILLDTLRIVDFRELQDYEEGHVLSAANVWYPELTMSVNSVDGLVAQSSTVEQVMGQIGLDNEIEVAIYGDSGSIWAARLFWILDYYGHTNMKVLNGGITRWNIDERPVTSHLPRLNSSSFIATPNSNKLVDAAWVMDHLNDPDVVVADARSSFSYESGHIPGAVSMPWTENTNEDDTFKPYEALISRFREGGVIEEKTVISYCQTGVLSAQNYFTLRLLGYPDVRLYDGSWADWSSDPERPVETGQ